MKNGNIINIKIYINLYNFKFSIFISIFINNNTIYNYYKYKFHSFFKLIYKFDFNSNLI